MANLRVTLTCPDGRSRLADIPDDVPVMSLAPVLAARMELPPGTYELMSKDLGRTLKESSTLASSGVRAGDTLHVLEVTFAPRYTVHVRLVGPDGVMRTVNLPADLPMCKIVGALLVKMGIQAHGYQLESGEMVRALDDSETLASAGIRAGDTLRLAPNYALGHASFRMSVRLRVAGPDNAEHQAELPGDETMDRLAPALAARLGLPAGKYRIIPQHTGRPLAEDDTLVSAGIPDGDLVKVAPAPNTEPLPNGDASTPVAYPPFPAYAITLHNGPGSAEGPEVGA